MFGRSKKAPPAPSNAPSGEGPSRSPLNVAITDTAPCQKGLRLQMSPEALKPIRAGVVSEFRRSATLPGFRKGKAPAEMVERQYAQQIQDELLRRAAKQALEQAAAQHQLQPVGPFELKRADMTAQGLALEATVEVEPSFALAGYQGIPLTQEALEVTPAEIDQALVSLQESMAQLVPKEGEAKERRVPALDQELAKDLGFETLEKLKEHVEAKLREQKQRAQAQQAETALCDELLRRHAFHVPPRLVEHQAAQVSRDLQARLLLAGTPEDRLEEETAKFAGQVKLSAERRVKLGFILERIAAQESITVTQDELVGRLWQLAQQWKKEPAEVRKMFDAHGLWPSVISAIRQEKTLAVVRRAAVVTPAAQTPVKAGAAAQGEAAPSAAHVDRIR